MSAENLVDTINSLTPEEQESVRHFIEFLKQRGASASSPFPRLNAEKWFETAVSREPIVLNFQHKS